MTRYYIINDRVYMAPIDNELYHYGVKGMKWGHRKRIDPVSSARSLRRSSQATSNMNNAKAGYKQAKQAYKQAKREERNSPEAKAERVAKAKRAAKIGAAAAATALAAYGAYKLNKYVKTKNCEIAAKRGFEASERMFSMMVDNAQKTMSSGKVNSMSISVNSGARALSDARARSSDSFRTAARNVVNYKRSGGSLSGLDPLERYRMYGTNSMKFGR